MGVPLPAFALALSLAQASSPPRRRRRFVRIAPAWRAWCTGRLSSPAARFVMHDNNDFLDPQR
jgi:hypothetical protein